MAVRTPRSFVNLLFVVGLILLGFEAVCAGLSLMAVTPTDAVFWVRNRLFAMACLPGVWLGFSLSYSRGDAGKYVRRWWPMLAAAFVAPLVLACLADGVLIVPSGSQAMAGALLKLNWAGLALHGVFLVSCVLILMNLEQTFTASVGTMRWRLKFMVLGLGLLFGARIYSSSQILLYRQASSLTLPVVDGIALVLAVGLMALALSRARLLEIEIYPSQTVLHSSITAIMAGIYLLVVGALAKIVVAVGGEAAATFQVKAFVVLLGVVGIGVLLLSDRIRQHIRLLVSRHFQRPIYDYRKVWSAFTERTTSLMDPVDFSRAVGRLMSETFGSLSVTVWLVNEESQQLAFAASTLLAEDKAADFLARIGDAQSLLNNLRQHPHPVDLDSGAEAWLADLRLLNTDFFRKGGNRICVPLVSGGEILGVIMLADRVSGVRFSVADLDLLKCIGDQVAAGLRNIQLSRQIQRSKELEAFQTMSTFLVHDLKNMAYTLSLMLQNMSEHFGDPEFQQDAMRGLSRSVNHLNDLIRRFGMLRQGLDMKLAEAGLNEVVETALTAIGPLPGIKLVKELSSLPRLMLDSDQLQKVITNLVLNAKEASGTDDVIRIQTGRREGWACLTIADNGKGMTQEFVRKSLFRPFQTTKKNGLGIGMFHSKMIVEAHRGRIEVESEPGKGATFRVLLPLERAE